jgi:hypothetical protein
MPTLHSPCQCRSRPVLTVMITTDRESESMPRVESAPVDAASRRYCGPQAQRIFQATSRFQFSDMRQLRGLSCSGHLKPAGLVHFRWALGALRGPGPAVFRVGLVQAEAEAEADQQKCFQL